MRTLLVLLVAAVVLVLPACGATQAQVDDLLEINAQKDVIAADTMVHLQKVSEAGVVATQPDTFARKFFDDTLIALGVKRADYETLSRLQLRTILAMKSIPEKDQERYFTQLLDIIDRLKGDDTKPAPVPEGGGQ